MRESRRQDKTDKRNKKEEWMKTLAFFNNKGGVGKTSLAYHVSWMLKELDHTVLSVDLDPQANLTGMFLSLDRLEELFENKDSLFYALEPLFKGTGDIQDPVVFEADDFLGLLPGDLNLSAFEGEFADSWPKCLDNNERAFRVTTAFYRLIKKAGEEIKADWAVIDMGPNLGAVNRAVLLAADYVIFPLGPDLFSFQGLKNVGGRLNGWREEWGERRRKGLVKEFDFPLPEGNMKPAGYVIMRHSIRHDRPVQAYQKWMDKMPGAYSRFVLQKEGEKAIPEKHKLAHLKDYRSLMPMAQEANKPVFHLKPGDGAIGSHFQAAEDCRKNFKALTEKILSVCVSVPPEEPRFAADSSRPVCV